MIFIIPLFIEEEKNKDKCSNSFSPLVQGMNPVNSLVFLSIDTEDKVFIERLLTIVGKETGVGIDEVRISMNRLI